MKRVKMKPISYLGFVLAAFGMFADRIFNIKNNIIETGLIILVIIGFALVIKGREVYESLD